ncbi:MAG TPA: hypothetical protein VGH28_04155 [Polyangiaceae bacterium]|jgi:hypothetical protein
MDRWRRPIAIARELAPRTWPRLALFVTLAVAAQWVWLSHAGSMVDFRDAQYFTLFEEAARRTVAKYHELPLWNPYYCGGIYALGTPSARFSSPTFVLTLLFGVLRSSPLVAVLLTVAGLEGMYRYGRSRGAGALGALLAAPLFALCGFFPRSGSFEWVNFFGFELLPWAALGLRRAFAGESRGAVIAGGATGLMTCFGGTYAAPYTLLVGAWELAEAVFRFRKDRRRIVSALALGAVAALIGGGIAAVRLWPIAETLASSPRVIGANDANAPLAIAHMLFGSRIPFRGDFLVGVLVLPLVVLGAIGKKSFWPVASACFFLWLAAGYGSNPSGYAMLRTIPPYTMLRSPERFLVPFALAYASLAAVGFGKLEALARRRKKAATFIVLGAMTLACIDDGVLVDNSWAWQRGRTLMAAPTANVGHREFANARGNRWLAAYYPALERGTLSCFDDYPIPQSTALRGDLEHEEYLSDATSGTVERRAWSPNSITLHVEAKKPARVIVNQNWHPGWRASIGTVLADDGRLAVDVPEGSHDLVLRFLPRSALGGGLASLVALLAAFVLWRKPRLGHVKQLAIAAAPFYVIVITMAVVSEPKRPRPPPALTSGEPIAQAEPPEGARPIGVKLEEGIELEAARIEVHRSADGPMLDFEIDWKLDHPAPDGLGIFVHMEPDKGDAVNVDHVAVATVATFETLPVHMTLRDELPGIAVESGKTYKIWAGVWRARRGGARLHVVDKGTATVDDDRVLVATIHAP